MSHADPFSTVAPQPDAPLDDVARLRARVAELEAQLDAARAENAVLSENEQR